MCCYCPELLNCTTPTKSGLRSFDFSPSNYSIDWTTFVQWLSCLVDKNDATSKGEQSLFALWLESLSHKNNFKEILISGRFHWFSVNLFYQPPADEAQLWKNTWRQWLGKTAKVDCGKGRKQRRCRLDQKGEVWTNLLQSVSSTQAWAVAEWEVVMDLSRLQLSRERAQRGQAQTGWRWVNLS